jgi:hypothetical protein
MSETVKSHVRGDRAEKAKTHAKKIDAGKRHAHMHHMAF